MDRRTSTMPMDFEWENRIGHVDPTSPFITAPRNAMNNTAKKRNHNSVLESPTRIGQQNPNLPKLREPENQSFFFNPPSPSKSNKPLPSVPSIPPQNTSLWEFRTPKRDIDFSSGGETPNTPDVNNDSEATPDTGAALRGGVSRMMSGNGKDERNSPSKPKRRESFFRSLFNASPQPSHSAKPEHYSRGGEKRIQKKRQRGLNQRYVREALDSESEDDGGQSRRRREKGSKKDKREQDNDRLANPEIPPAEPQGSTIASIFSFIEKHPGLPHILSYYAQLLLNFFLVFSAMYLIWSFWSSVTHEVNIQSERAETEMLLEIVMCGKEFEDNHCDQKSRPPRLEAACSNWEACMKRDAKKVARASVSAKTFAMIFNSFVEEIGYKAMLFAALILIGSFVVSNYAFASYRAHHRPAAPQYDPYMHPPATPQRYPSGGFIDQQGYFTPYTSFHPSQSQPQLEIEPSPTRGVDVATGTKQRGVARTISYR